MTVAIDAKGARLVFFGAGILTAVATALVPLAASQGVYYFVTVRILQVTQLFHSFYQEAKYLSLNCWYRASVFRRAFHSLVMLPLVGQHYIRTGYLCHYSPVFRN
jgi:hypothetical protein